MKPKLLGVVLVLALPACATKYVDPAPPTVLPATAVAASYDRTWEATVTWFAERNISIQTIEKASGIIVADVPVRYMPNRTPVLDKKGRELLYKQSPPVYADCGSKNGWGYNPTSMIYNIRVLGDGSKSTVQVNSRYVSNRRTAPPPELVDCSSTGKWERDIQSYIKAKAEAK